MATSLEELRVLRSAETVADAVWLQVLHWDAFARKVVGEQLARAADSVGANIVEAYGRFHYGEKLRFLYYARGSLFEAKYWLNRAQARHLMASDEVQEHASRLTGVARQLNAFARNLKTQRRGSPSEAVQEEPGDYTTDSMPTTSPHLFHEAELEWLQTISDL